MSTLKRTSSVAPQNTTNIQVGYVGPSAMSQTKLGPGTYSLSKRSNVPFITLVGSAGWRKTISWGEIAEVPEGQSVAVQNASYHGGDIFVNKGGDPCNRPSRITVPVEFETVTVVTDEGSQKAWKPVYPCDTRAAKRAYISVDANVVPAAGLTAFIRGRKLDGSMKSANSLAMFISPFGPGTGFLGAVSIAIGTTLAYIPLGLAANGDVPHNLLDAGDVFFLLGGLASTLDQYMIWPADASVFGFPSGEAVAPGSWYIVEYD